MNNIQAQFDDITSRLNRLESPDISSSIPNKLSQLEKKAINNIVFYCNTAVMDANGEQHYILPPHLDFSTDNIVLNDRGAISYMLSGNYILDTTGTGYTNGNVLTVVGGNGDGQITVTAVDGLGRVTDFSVTNMGTGYASGLYNVTGGTGTFASFIFDSVMQIFFSGGESHGLVNFVILRTTNISTGI